MEGGAPMTPSVARRVIALFREVRPPVQADYDLTPHELRLLSLLVEGHNFKSAAAELGVTTHGISFHMRHVYEKLQVHSKSEAVAKALRERIVR
jgi:DNA-binding NarL/FixJ family response regulator